MTTKAQKDCSTCNTAGSWSSGRYADSKSKSYSSTSISEKNSTASACITSEYKAYHSAHFTQGAANNVSVNFNSKAAEKKKLISELNKKFGK